MGLTTNTNFLLLHHFQIGFYNRSGVFTARYGLNAYTTRIRFVRKGLIPWQERCYLIEIIPSTRNEITRCEQKQTALEKKMKWQNNNLKNSGKYTGPAKKMYTQFNERKLYVVYSITVNLKYISVNTTIYVFTSI